MSTDRDTHTEQDDRFISGRWRGFWIQGPVKSRTELVLVFRDGRVSGEGRDWVGDFLIRGDYDPETGRVGWLKQYVGAHAIRYDGAAETGEGIWGVWRMLPDEKGGFQIWPEREGGESNADHARAERPRTREAPRVYEADPALAGAL